MFKIFLSVLLFQATASIAEECSNQVIVTERITNVHEVIGNWSVVFIWTGETTLRSMASSQCFNASMVEVTAEEVAAKKRECGQSSVAFDYNNVVMKAVVQEAYSTDRLIAHDGEYGYIQQNCNLVTKVDARRVSDNYVLMVYPDYNVADLLSKTVPDAEDLRCTVMSIDVMQNSDGFPLCYK